MRLRPAAIGCAMCLCALGARAVDGSCPSWAAAADSVDEATDDVTATIWVVLSPKASDAARNADDLAREVAALGPDAVAPAVAILLGASAEPDMAYVIQPLAIEKRAEILTEALKRLPENAVMDELDRHVQPETPIDERLHLVRILASIGGRTALDRALVWIAALEPIQWEREYVRTQIEFALATLVGRDAAMLKRIEQELSRADTRLAAVLVRVLAATHSARAVPMLMRRLGRDPELDLAVLQSIGAIGPGGQAVLTISDLKRVRAFLDSSDVRLQRGAAALLTQLADDECCSTLVSLLDSQDVLTAATAHRSLKAITGQSLGTEREEWVRWLERERRWLEEEFPRLEVSLGSGVPERIVEASGALLGHRFYRRRAARALAPALSSADPAVQRLVCGILRQLGSSIAAPRLVDLLESPDDSVRHEAWSTLRALTGLELPPNPKRWRDVM